MTSIVAGTAGARPAVVGSTRFFQVAVAVLIGLRLIFAFIVPPTADEAYYWLWGQHLQWSYLDHAPLVGWSAGISERLLGWTPIGLHLLPLASTAGVAVVLRLWASEASPDEPERYFWASLAIFLASPLAMAVTTVLYPDGPMICFGFAAVYCLEKYLNAPASPWRLYLAGMGFLGLSILGKYNGALLAAGILIAVLLHPAWRRLLHRPLGYAGIAGIALLLLPIIGWNAANDWAGFRLQTSARFDHIAGSFSAAGPERLLWQTALFLSPMLLWPMGAMFTRLQGASEGVARIARTTLLVTLTLFFGLSAWAPASGQVAPHWLIAGLLPLFLLAPALMPRWLAIAHVAFGVIVSGAIVAYFAAAPLVTDALGVGDIEASRNFAQPGIAAAVDADRWAFGADFIATKNYELAAKLSWGRQSDADLVVIGDLGGQFALWNAPAAHLGQSAIILSDDAKLPKDLSARFARVSPIGAVTPTRFGRPLGTFYLFLGQSLI